jgi:hydrogenase maturation protease
MPRPPIAIIGVGNYLRGDEGIGIHAVEKLRLMAWPDDVEIIDGGIPGVGLLHLIEARRLAIIIDCADFGGKPGEIEVFDPDRLEREEREEISLHATDLLTSLELGRRVGRYPQKAMILGVQPKSISPGVSLSPELVGALDKIPDMVKEVIREIG